MSGTSKTKLTGICTLIFVLYCNIPLIYQCEHPPGDNNLYDDIPEATPQLPGLSFTTMSKLGLSVPNPAPEVNIDENPFVQPLPLHGKAVGKVA